MTNARRHSPAARTAAVRGPIETLEPRRLLSAIDPTFGTNGATALPAPAEGEIGSAILLHQSDGDFIVVRSTQSEGDSSFNDPFAASDEPTVSRYTPAGAPDTTFGGDGSVTLSGTPFEVTAATVDAQDRIVLGTADGIERLLPDGTPDPSFATGGTFAFSPVPNRYSTSVGASSLPIQLAAEPDGSLIVETEAEEADYQYATSLVHITADGASSTTVISLVSPGSEIGNCAVLPDGSVLTATAGLSGTTPVVLDDYGLNGSPVGAYGTDGTAAVGIGDDAVPQLVALADGDVLMMTSNAPAASSNPAATNTFHLVRLTAAGSLDPAFDGGGVLSFQAHAATLAAGPDGTVLVATSGSGTSTDATLAVTVHAFTAAGVPDPTVGGGTGTYSVLSGAGDVLGGMLITTADQPVLLVGQTDATNSGYPNFSPTVTQAPTLVRLRAAGDTPDTTPPTFTFNGGPTPAWGAPDLTFSVTYRSSSAISLASVLNATLSTQALVPEAAIPISASSTTDAPTITVTYAVRTPNGTWNTQDNGTYDITYRGGAESIADVNGNVLAPPDVDGALGEMGVLKLHTPKPRLLPVSDGGSGASGSGGDIVTVVGNQFTPIYGGDAGLLAFNEGMAWTAAPSTGPITTTIGSSFATPAYNLTAQLAGSTSLHAGARGSVLATFTNATTSYYHAGVLSVWLTLAATTGASVNDPQLAVFRLNVNIPVGRSHRMRIPFRLPSSLAAGNYVIEAQASLEEQRLAYTGSTNTVPLPVTIDAAVQSPR